MPGGRSGLIDITDVVALLPKEPPARIPPAAEETGPWRVVGRTEEEQECRFEDKK